MSPLYRCVTRHCVTSWHWPVLGAVTRLLAQAPGHGGGVGQQRLSRHVLVTRHWPRAQAHVASRARALPETERSNRWISPQHIKYSYFFHFCSDLDAKILTTIILQRHAMPVPITDITMMTSLRENVIFHNQLPGYIPVISPEACLARRLSDEEQVAFCSLPYRPCRKIYLVLSLFIQILSITC